MEGLRSQKVTGHARPIPTGGVMEYKKVSDGYWIHINPKYLHKNQREWRKLKKCEAVVISGFEGFDLFLHNDIINKALLTVSDAVTGLAMVRHIESKDEVMTECERELSLSSPALMQKGIWQGIKEHGISPRYKLTEDTNEPHS